MLASTRGRRGMAVAPHALAAQSALDVLREGGNAIEAMIAAAATIAVVYPHMNSIGGDSFWLIHVPGKAPGTDRRLWCRGATCIDRLVSSARRQRGDSIPRGACCKHGRRGGVGLGRGAGAVAPRAARPHAAFAVCSQIQSTMRTRVCQSR